MSALKATPGPWRVEEGTTLVWGACNEDDSTSYGAGVPVAEANVWQSQWATKRHRFHYSEPEANAHLIAAAPELYEAARLFVEEYDSGDQDDGVALMLAYNRALEAAKAAIAKARGEHSLTQSDPLKGLGE